MAVSVAVCFSHACWRRRPGGVEGKKKSKACWTSRASHAQFLAQFLVRLATKIIAFFIKLADFALMGPAGPISDVAQSLTATSMVWKHCFTSWCESSRVLKSYTLLFFCHISAMTHKIVAKYFRRWYKIIFVIIIFATFLRWHTMSSQINNN